MTMSRALLTGVLLTLGFAAAAAAQQDAVEALRSGAAPAPEYLYVWATAIDTAPGPPATPDGPPTPVRRGVVLLTVDLRAGSPDRGSVVHALLVDSAGRSAHHTEHFLAADGLLFANDFGTGRTHIVDVRTPGTPRISGAFTTAGPFAYPHSFAQLPNGNVLATYQWQGLRQPPGGIAELRRDGTAVRWARAATPGVDSTHIQPYSLEVLPHLDRVVTTSTSMTDNVGVHVQVWRLSDLTLLHTLEVPHAPAHAAHAHGSAHDSTYAGEHHRLPGEPRVLADGRTVMFGTFTCGLYRLTGVEAVPTMEFALAFPGDNCAVPVRIGNWWIQTVPADRALVAIDVSDPAAPRETARIAFAAPAEPHWLAADASGRWLAMTSGRLGDPFIHLAVMEPSTGALARADIGSIDVSRVTVPGIGTVLLVPHGAVFSRPASDDAAHRSAAPGDIRGAPTTSHRSRPVYVQFVRLVSSLSDDDVIRIMEERAPQFRAIPGLLEKYYGRDPGTGAFAGIYIWDSEASMRAFLETELRRSIPTAYQVSEPPRVEFYEVLFPLRGGADLPPQTTPSTTP